MGKERVIIISLHIPDDAKLVISALRRALGFFKHALEHPDPKVTDTKSD